MYYNTSIGHSLKINNKEIVMKKFVCFLAKLLAVVLVLAVAGMVYFYIDRKEHFLTVKDYFEELKGTLSTIMGVALFVP